MISEELCDTKDWSDAKAAKKSALPAQG